MKLFNKQLHSPAIISRRNLLIGGAAAATSGLIMPDASSASIAGDICLPPGGVLDGPIDEAFDVVQKLPLEGERAALIYNHRNGEVFNEIYYADGAYIPSVIQKYSHFARDWRTNEVKQMDPGLLDIIYFMTDELNVTRPWTLTSGYRSPASNSTVGGVKRSQHMYGKANDLVHPQVSPSKVFQTALKFKRGGCGRYSNFTHVDTGTVRQWSG